MAEKVLGIGTDVLVVDNDLRTIAIPPSIKSLGVASDDGVLRLKFRLPRYYGEFDLSEFKVRINYLNAMKLGDVYKVADVVIEENAMTFSWLVGRFATVMKGKVHFNVCLKKIVGSGEEAEVVKEFNTTPAMLPVLEGLETTEQVIQRYPDLVETWQEELFGRFHGRVDETLKIAGQAADAAETGRMFSELVTNLASKANMSALEVERARIDQLLKSGTKASDGELVDIRVSYDGYTYESAGTAVREQIGRAVNGHTTVNSYTINVSSTYPIDMKINADSRYKIAVDYNDNVSKLDIGYTTVSGNDIVFANDAESTVEYEITPEVSGTRFRFWTYLIDAVDTTVTVRITILGSNTRETNLENAVAELDRSVSGIYSQSNLQIFEEYKYRMGNTMSFDIPYTMLDDAEYTMKLGDFTGEYLKNVDVYLFNSMSDYKSAGRITEIGGSVTFKGNSAYAYVRAYVQLTQAETTPADVILFLGKHNPESLTIRVANLESSVGIKKAAPNVLIIGDSYSEMGKWVNQMKSMIDVGTIVNLGVSSASIKDKYRDRTTYPYDSRPVTNDTRGGNVNTFGSQIEKLKRLMAGVDLDANENKIYTTEDEYPDIIFIQGGANDSIDESTDNYEDQIYTIVSAYIKRKSESTAAKQYVRVPTDYEDTDRTNFAGAMRYLYGVLHEMFPNALIFFITPAGLNYMAGGNYLQFIRGDQISMAARLLCTPVIDWTTNGRLTFCDNVLVGSGTQSDPYISDYAGEYSLDALHPNDAGARLLAMEVVKVLRDYNLVRYK